METTIFKTRAEITGKMQECINKGLTCYRVRVACECKPRECKHRLRNPTMNLQANQRNGVIVIKKDRVIALYVRCKVCSEPPEI
jgi:hypothetical protein